MSQGQAAGADVVVAGAGPVGLLTAALLDAAGVRVRVFEREDGPSVHSKATTMHPRTLEALTVLETGGRRLSDLLLDQGRPTPRAHFAALPAMLDYSALDTPFPFVLMIPQARTERTLADHLRRRGVPLHYGRPVTAVEQDGAAVRVRAGDEWVEARYLVGADGARSTVRGLAGIGFPGTPPSLVGFTADVELDEAPVAPVHSWYRDTGSASIVPLPEGRHRIFGTEAADTRLTVDEVRARRAEPLTPEGLRATLRRITGSDCGVRTVSWISKATDGTRHADRYRAGRVLIAGDAAHIHLPAGGQGLNVGLQDAANLAWKLAAEHQGRAAPELVDGPFDYDSERRPISERLAANTLAQGALMSTFTPAGEALRDLFSHLIAQGGDTARELTGWLSGLDLAYPAPAGAHPLTGTRAPDLALTGRSLLRSLRQDGFVLVDLTPTGRFARLASPRVDVRAARPGPRPDGWSGPAAVLVRPDGYVAAATDSPAPDAFSDEIARWTTPHTPPGPERRPEEPRGRSGPGHEG